MTGLNYHRIELTYGTIFTANSQFKIRDLEVYRPVCYLDNNRIRKCTLDIINKKIIMNFQFSININTNYHVLFSIIDPRNPDIFGFLPTISVSNVVVSYVLSGSSTVYYTET